MLLFILPGKRRQAIMQTIVESSGAGLPAHWLLLLVDVVETLKHNRITPYSLNNWMLMFYLCMVPIIMLAQRIILCSLVS